MRCIRCPGHGTMRLDGPISLRLCDKCYLEWQRSALRDLAFQALDRFEAQRPAAEATVP